MKNRKKVHFVPVIGFEPIIVWLLKPLRMPIPPYRYLCGKSEIRTHGPLTVGSLVNCWFKPLTHLSDWLNDENRTHTQSATNFCPTIRLRSTFSRCVLDSNQCKRFCRPSPNHSDNSPYCSFSRIRTYTLTFVVLCDNPFHYETICTGLQTRTVIKGFGDLHATIAPNRMCCRNNKIRTCDI